MRPADGRGSPAWAPDRVTIAVASEYDAARACRACRNVARTAELSDFEAHCLTTAVSELATNLVMHATGDRWISMRVVSVDGRLGVEVRAEDSGPGIADVALAMEDGFSTNRGLGSGLPGARRLTDEFFIDSLPGAGTVKIARIWGHSG